MASFRKRNGKWQAQIRRRGHTPLARTFSKKHDATVWAQTVELELERGNLYETDHQLRTLTVSDLIERYIEDVMPTKRCGYVETYILRRLQKEAFASQTLHQVSPQPFAALRDRRLRSVKAATIVRELSLLKHVFHVAINEWGLKIKQNPLDGIRKPQINNRRCRRLDPEEFSALQSALRSTRCKQIESIIMLAIETAMRRGEILKIKWQDINFEQCVLHIPETKTGVPRTIPLTSDALMVLNRCKNDSNGPFSLSISAVDQAWQRLVKRAEITDLHFHDLRHEAISRFFERGLSVPEVALISGHKDFRMLARYTHLKPTDIANKLRCKGHP